MAARVKKKPARQASGGSRLTAAGKRPVLLGLAPDDHDLIRRAAEAERRPVTQFLTVHGLAAAKKILGADVAKLFPRKPTA